MESYHYHLYILVNQKENTNNSVLLIKSARDSFRNTATNIHPAAECLMLLRGSDGTPSDLNSPSAEKAFLANLTTCPCMRMPLLVKDEDIACMHMPSPPKGQDIACMHMHHPVPSAHFTQI